MTIANLYNGDCETVLHSIPDKTYDLIFTSPPYYNARDYSHYDSYEAYLQKMSNCLKECNRTLKDGKFIVINVSPVIQARTKRSTESVRYPIPFDFHKILTENGFYYKNDVIWVKPEPSAYNRNGVYQRTGKPLTWNPNIVTESILIYRKNCDFLIDKLIKGRETYQEPDEYKDTSNVWYINPKHSQKHPAIIPIELCKRVIRYYSFQGDMILDPFAGIGTVGKACKELNRNFSGIEIYRNYFEIMQKSLTQP